MRNFLPFKDETQIRFCTDPSKNVTIILAENNVGKSSLLKAFLWCLYGGEALKDDVLNVETKNFLMKGMDGKADKAYVRLELEHDDHHYIIIRTMRYSHQGNRLNKSESFEINLVDSNGNCSPARSSEYKKIINTILPKDLSEYFFFEEKKFSNIGETKSIKKSVEDFSGLTVLNNAIRDLNGAKRVLSDEIVLTNNAKLTSFKNKYDEYSKKAEQSQKDYDNYQKEKKYWAEQRKNKTEELFEHADADHLKKQIETERNHLQRIKEDELKKENNVILKFNQNLFEYLTSNIYIQKTVEEILNNSDDGEPVDSVTGVEVKTIDELIQRGYCICGTKFEKDSDIYRHLMKERAKVPPNSLSDVVKNLRSRLSAYSEYKKSYKDSVEQAYKELSDSKGEIERTTNSLIDLENQIDDNTDTAQIRQDMKTAEEKEQSFERKMREAQGSVSSNESQVKHYEEQIRLLTRHDSNNKLAQLRIDYVDAIKESLQTKLDEKREIILEKMNEYVSNYFNKLYHGELYLDIDENYKIKFYLDSEHTILGEKLGTGTSDIKNFAFVFGLEQLAKDKIMNESEDDDIFETEQYPMFLDAPFSHADGVHIENLCTLVPTVANQVIIAISTKDWNLTEEYLKEYVGKIYRMNPLGEQYTVVHEMSKEG